jgi:hypothetical protein
MAKQSKRTKESEPQKSKKKQKISNDVSNQNEDTKWYPISPDLKFSRYRISKRGDIFSEITKRVLSPGINLGYKVQVLVDDDGKRRMTQIHRLVACTFIPNTENLPTVHHKDFDRVNNSVDNLEWASYSYQIKNRKPRIQKPKSIPVEQYDISGKLVATWNSPKEAANSFGSKSGEPIFYACTESKSHIAFGYFWKYKEFTNLPDEIWKPIKGYPSYFVSSLGRFKHQLPTRETELLPTSTDNYFIICILGRTRPAHIYVCEAFHGDRPSSKHVVNHKNGDKKWNKYDNLEWMTKSENSLHAVKTGLFDYAKTRIKLRKPIWQYTLTGDFITKHESGRAAAQALGKKGWKGQKELTGGSQKVRFGFLWSCEPLSPKLQRKLAKK